MRVHHLCSANKPLVDKSINLDDKAASRKAWTKGSGLNFYVAVRESRTGEVPCDTQLQVVFEDHRSTIGLHDEEWPQSPFFVNITGVPPKGTCDPSRLPRRNVRVPLPPGAANYKVWRMRLRATEPAAITTTTALNNEVTEVHGFNFTVQHYRENVKNRKNVKMPVQWVGLRAVTITGEENYISQYYVLLILLTVVAMMPALTVAVAAFLERYFPGGEKKK